MVDETVTRKCKWYKLTDGKYKLLKPKVIKKNQIQRNKNLIQKCLSNKLKTKKKKKTKNCLKNILNTKVQVKCQIINSAQIISKEIRLQKRISNNFEYLFDKVKELPPNEGVEECKVLKTVKMILEFNRQQQGKGLKILTRNQMLSRLPISLAQLKAGNNSEKLKNEIRQILYSF